MMKYLVFLVLILFPSYVSAEFYQHNWVRRQNDGLSDNWTDYTGADVGSYFLIKKGVPSFILEEILQHLSLYHKGSAYIKDRLNNYSYDTGKGSSLQAIQAYQKYGNNYEMAIFTSRP